MIDPRYLDDDDFELDLIRDPMPSTQVPDTLRTMRARRVRVDMPTGPPSVQEVLHNPAGSAAAGQPTTRTVRRLMRVQLRLAVSLMAWFFGLVVIVNLAFHFSPALASAPLLGVPLEWLFPTVMVIPLLMLLGWFYIRRATAHEDQLVQQLTDHPGERS